MRLVDVFSMFINYLEENIGSEILNFWMVVVRFVISNNYRYFF